MISKIYYQDSQEELYRASDGVMVSVFEPGELVGNIKKASAKSAFLTDDDLNRFRPDKDHFLMHLVAMGATEDWGPNRNCFKAGARVRLIYGSRPIETLVEGDLVLTHKGRYRPVEEVFSREYCGNFVEISCTGLPGQLTPCTEDHLFYAFRGDVANSRKLLYNDAYRAGEGYKKKGQQAINKSFQEASTVHASFIAARDLRPGDWLFIPGEENITDDALNPGDYSAWLLGLYLADACLVRCYKEDRVKNFLKYTSLLFTLGAGDDADVIPELERQIKKLDREFSIQKSFTSEKGRRIQFGHTELAQKCEILFGNEAVTKDIHSAIFSQSESWKLEFLAGWFDGDGHLVKKEPRERYHGTLTGSTASYDLALSIQRLLASCGVPSSVCAGTNKEENGCFGSGELPIYTVSVGSAFSDKILKFTKRNKSHGKPRIQQARTRVVNNGQWVKIKSVRIFEDRATVYDVRVAEDHSFVAGVAVHNCDGYKRATLEKDHPTFVSHGHYFEEHNNRDPKIARGTIKFSAYNPDMNRVELFVWGDVKKAAEDFEMARAGKPLSYSMSCRIPWDQCNCCMHKAAKISLHCRHMKDTPGQYLEEFKKYAYVDNPHCTFFDISKVKNPADRTAHYLAYRFPDRDQEELLKAASQAPVILGSDWAEFEGVKLPEYDADEPLEWTADHRQVLEKLARADQYAKEIFLANPRTSDPKVAFVKAAGPYLLPERIGDEALETLRKATTATVMRGLAKSAAVLPFTTFVAYITGASEAEAAADEKVKSACFSLPGVFRDLLSGGQSACGNMHREFQAGSEFMSDCDPGNDDAVQKFMDEATQKYGIKAEPARSRVIQITIKTAARVSPKSQETKGSAEGRVLAEAYAQYLVQSLVNMEKAGTTLTDQEILALAGYTNSLPYR